MTQTDFESPEVFNHLLTQRSLFISQEIDYELATKTCAQLLWLDLCNHEADITIYINSGGGVVEGGLFTIYDTIQAIQAPVRTINIGEAYSSAAVILSCGTKGKRLAFPNSKMMIHTVQVMDVNGSQAQLQQESKRVKILNERIMELLAIHCGQPLSKIKRDCSEDKYLSPKEALEYGMIDDIIEPAKQLPLLISKSGKKC